MVLGKLPVPAHPTIWMIVGQGPIVLKVGIGVGRFRILGGPRFRILGGPRGGQIPSRHMTS